MSIVGSDLNSFKWQSFLIRSRSRDVYGDGVNGLVFSFIELSVSTLVTVISAGSSEFSDE